VEPIVTALTIGDRLVLAAANLFVWLRHPWLSLSFWYRRRRPPFLATPRGVSELVQWRKIFDRNPLYPVLADKLRVKDWAHAQIPGLAAAEVLWTGTRAADLPAELLRPDVVIKTNHGTGTNCFPGRRSLPRPELDALLDGWLRRRFDTELQWAYGLVPPTLMVERLVGQGAPLTEMTFRCAGGRVATAFVATEQKTPRERNAYFTGDGTRLPPRRGAKPEKLLPADYELPESFWRAHAVAEQLSRDLDFVRVDLMVHDDVIYVCEMTLYPGSGFSDEQATHTAPHIERAWVDSLEKAWFLSSPQPWPARLYGAALKRWRLVRRAELDRET
jgi:hypothetical protein